jgi:hypothetical protein
MPIIKGGNKKSGPAARSQPSELPNSETLPSYILMVLIVFMKLPAFMRSIYMPVGKRRP